VAASARSRPLDRRRPFALVQHIGMVVVDEPAVERAA
jgi:hypothetical protein